MVVEDVYRLMTLLLGAEREGPVALLEPCDEREGDIVLTFAAMLEVFERVAAVVIAKVS